MASKDQKRLSESERRKLSILKPEPKTAKTLEIATDEDFEHLEHEPTYPEHRLNVGVARPESTLTRELNISANDVPVPPGSFITDLDGIALTIGRLSQAFIAARDRLEWSGHTLVSQEKALWAKDVLIAKLQGIDPPPAPPKMPFFDEPTIPNRVLIADMKLVYRICAIVAVIAAVVILCVVIFFAGKK